VIDSAIENGTTAIRGFVDVDTIAGLTGLRALLRLKTEYDERVVLQLAIFPQEGIWRNAGCDSVMEEAVRLGVDVVAATPSCERTPNDAKKHIDFCLDLAKRYDKDAHFLVDDGDSAYSRGLEYLAARTIEEGYEGRVVAGHCGALGSYDHGDAEHVIHAVKTAGITICSNPQISLVINGRHDRGIVRRGITRVKEFLAAGVNVAAAQDDVDDPFYPFGKPDQLEVGQYMAHVAQLVLPADLDQVFDMITSNAAIGMRLDGYGLGVGDRADVVVHGARSVHEALRLIPPRRWVFSGGKLVSESWIERRSTVVDRG